MLKTRISIPASVKKGEVFEIKTLVSHPMHTGFQIDNRGQFIPRNILSKFECRLGDELVFSADFFPSVAANPYLSFFLKAEQSDELSFRWIDQDGKVTNVVKTLNVES